jgi:hypothetical protein
LERALGFGPRFGDRCVPASGRIDKARTVHQSNHGLPQRLGPADQRIGGWLAPVPLLLLDEPGSGTLVNAKAILGAYGLSEKDIRPEFAP